MDFEMDLPSFTEGTGSLEDFSIEQISSQLSNLTNDEQIKMKHEMLSNPNKLMWIDYKKEIPGFVSSNGENDYLIIVDNELVIKTMFEDHQVISKLIQQISSIPEEGILNVIISLNCPDINDVIVEAGVFISNVIRRAKCKKIFNFGSEVGIADLAVAMCCDGIYVSDFASVSIVRADDGLKFHKYRLPLYRNIVKSIYNYWMQFGLFTADEITGLFSAEAENSIHLMSDEIKERVKSKLVVKA